MQTENNPVTAPSHYTVYPVQPIVITRHLGFCLGNAVKYVLRAPYKGGAEDLYKALQYLEWEKETPGCHAPVDAYIDALAVLTAHFSQKLPEEIYPYHVMSFLLFLVEYLAAADTNNCNTLIDGMCRSVRAMLRSMEG